MVDQSETSQITNAIDILDISGPESTTVKNNSALNLDLLGGSGNKNQFTSNVADIFSVDLGLNQISNPIVQQPIQLFNPQTINYQQPVNYQDYLNYQQQQSQQPINYQTSYQQQPQSMYMQNVTDQFSLNSQYLSQSAQQQSQPIYSNITLSVN